MPSTIRARSLLFVAVVLVAAACAGDDTAATSSSSVTTTTTTVAPGTTTSTIPPTTVSPTTAPPSGTPIPDEVDAALTVANDDGAFLIENGFAFQLVEGPVELALADGTGGLVFQRSADDFRRDPTETIISYLPPESFEPQDLLVPTGDQYLTLWDIQDGEVWYTRREGGGPEDALETLRTYDLTTRTVEQFATTGAWESGSIGISAGGPHAVAYWHASVSSGFTFYDESGEIVSVDGDPYEPNLPCEDGELFDTDTNDFLGEPCFEYAELSDDGRLAYHRLDFDGAQFRLMVAVVDLATGDELFRLERERPDQGWMARGMDLRGDQLLVNRTETGEFDAPYIDAFLVDLATEDVVEIGFAGQARFLIGPMGIS